MGAIGLAALGVSWLDPVRDAGFVEHVTELAVVIALFSTGLKLERKLSWRQWSTVTRLLAIGMPAFIALAALFGAGVMGLSWGAAIVLAAALAPTDPVLAGDIGVGPPGEDDEEHEPHFGVSAEAGFNDAWRSRSCCSGSPSPATPRRPSGSPWTSSTPWWAAWCWAPRSATASPR